MRRRHYKNHHCENSMKAYHFFYTSTFHWSINYLHDSLSIVSCIHSCFTYEHKEWRLTFRSVFVLIIYSINLFKIVFLELNLWEYPESYEWFDETFHGFELNTSTLRLNEFIVIFGSRDHCDTKGPLGLRIRESKKEKNSRRTT